MQAVVWLLLIAPAICTISFPAYNFELLLRLSLIINGRAYNLGLGTAGKVNKKWTLSLQAKL